MDRLSIQELERQAVAVGRVLRMSCMITHGDTREKFDMTGGSFSELNDSLNEFISKMAGFHEESKRPSQCWQDGLRLPWWRR
jgi:hypothetical protein